MELSGSVDANSNYFCGFEAALRDPETPSTAELFPLGRRRGRGGGRVECGRAWTWSSSRTGLRGGGEPRGGACTTLNACPRLPVPEALVPDREQNQTPRPGGAGLRSEHLALSAGTFTARVTACPCGPHARRQWFAWDPVPASRPDNGDELWEGAEGGRPAPPELGHDRGAPGRPHPPLPPVLLPVSLWLQGQVGSGLRDLWLLSMAVSTVHPE